MQFGLRTQQVRAAVNGEIDPDEPTAEERDEIRARWARENEPAITPLAKVQAHPRPVLVISDQPTIAEQCSALIRKAEGWAKYAGEIDAQADLAAALKAPAVEVIVSAVFPISVDGKRSSAASNYHVAVGLIEAVRLLRGEDITYFTDEVVRLYAIRNEARAAYAASPRYEIRAAA